MSAAVGHESAVPSFRVIMSLRKVRGNFERMFDKSLTDLVRGIRNNRDNEVSVTLRPKATSI